MKRRIFLFAVLLPCIAFALTAMFAFKPDGGKPVIETSVAKTFDDSDVWYAQYEANLQTQAYNTWVADGSPGEDLNVKPSGKQDMHYCCETMDGYYLSKRGALKWVGEKMANGNAMHVHYFQTDYHTIGGVQYWYAKVKYWTSAPCAELCNW